MAAPAVVERLDEVEHRQARRVPGPEGAALDQLALERREEALAQGVIVAVTDGTHRQRHVRLPAALAEGDRRVLRAVIAVVDDRVRGQLRMNTRHTVGAPRVAVDRRDARRRAAPQPRLVTAARDSQHSAHRRHPVFGLIRLHERKDLPGTALVSRANQAAAFLRISRSSRSRFSRS